MEKSPVNNGNPSYGNFNITYANKLAKSSKAPSADYNQILGNSTSNGKAKGEVSPTENLGTVLEIVLGDEEIRAFYSILRDSVIRSGWELKGSASMVKKGNELLNKIRFRKKLKRIVFDLLVMKHAFVEIEKNDLGTKVINIHVLDPDKVKPILDIKGELKGWYMESPFGTQEEDIYWKPDEIAHFIIDDMTPTFWGKTDIHTLKDLIRLKKSVMEHIEILFKQNMFRPHFHGKNIGENDIDQFIEMFMTAQYDKNAPLITIGTEDMVGKKYVDESVLLPLIEMLRELRNKMLTLIRVPPIIAGTVDNSNRSNSDIQAHFSFMNRIQSLQEDIEDDMVFELLTKLGLDNLEFKFNQNNNRDLKEMVDIAILLISAGAKRKSIIEWMREKGYDIPEDVFPELSEEEEKQLIGAGETGSNENGTPKGGNSGESSLPENSDLKRSRQKQDKSNTDGYRVKK